MVMGLMGLMDGLMGLIGLNERGGVEGGQGRRQQPTAYSVRSTRVVNSSYQQAG